MRVRACLRSGACCKVAPCPFGEWDSVAGQCRFLETAESAAGVVRYRCGRYEAILALPVDAGADVAPAFGAGCCMPLGNTARDRIRESVFGGAEQFVSIDMAGAAKAGG